MLQKKKINKKNKKPAKRNDKYRLKPCKSFLSVTNINAPANFDQNRKDTNVLLIEREGRTGQYLPEVAAVRTKRSEVRTKTTEGQYSPVRLELARLVSSLLYGTQAMLVLNLPAFENKTYTAYDRFHGNGPNGEIPTKKEPIRTLGFALPYNVSYQPSEWFIRQTE